jgi:GNAT superfamily N-acetyltransferase
MEIRNLQDRDIDGVVELWNESCGTEMPYKPFTRESFKEKFLKNPHYQPEGSFVLYERDTLVGFANGLYKRGFLPGETHENTPGYLTFVLVAKDHRGKGYGTALYKRVEDFFRNSGKKQIQVIFFNPINLEWIVPGTEDHDHPNAPGVDMDGPGYKFLQQQGFVQRTCEVSFHLDLSGYELPEKLMEREKQLQKKGIVIEYYDSARHDGFDQLFDNLKHEYWRKDIKDNLSLEKPHPILIVNHQGKIRGFAGPIAVQPSGRGWFAGIGIDPGYGGQGIGTVLFSRLMKSFSDRGARFSTLFTGEENPARRIYERTGFKPVKKWAVMGKEL